MLISQGPTADFTRSIPIVMIITLTVSYLFALLVTFKKRGLPWTDPSLWVMLTAVVVAAPPPQAASVTAKISVKTFFIRITRRTCFESG